MSYKPITFDETLHAGDKIQFKFTFTDLILRPTSDTLLQAIDQVASFNVSTVNYDVLNSIIGITSSGEIQGVVSEDTTGSQLADDIRQIMSGFTTIRGIQIKEIDKDTITIADAVTLPTSTTIGLAAVALIAIVVLVLFLKID